MGEASNNFTRTGQDAWMVYDDGITWYAKQVKWIAATRDGRHIIEETIKCNNDYFTHLRIWIYVFPTKSAAKEYADKRISEIKYIKTRSLTYDPKRSEGIYDNSKRGKTT
jgi:hypothetical protein